MVLSKILVMSLDTLIKNLGKIRFEMDLKLVCRDKVILDFASARLLYYIHKSGALLKASKLLGIPYSRAWIMIEKIESNLGRRIINRHRGGMKRGYSLLNDLGIRLLDIYVTKLKSLGFSLEANRLEVSVPDLVLIGSDDSLLREMLGRFTQLTKWTYEYHVVGSIVGLLHVVLRDADIVVAHIYDPETGEYNIPHIKKLGLADHVIVLRGYKRTLVFAMPKLFSRNIDECIRKCKTIAVRSIGSGTELYLRQSLLAMKTKKPKLLYFDTHKDAAEATAKNIADACIVIEYEANRLGLEYLKLKEENFDFIILKEKYNRKPVKEFLDYVERNKETIDKLHGYITPKEFLERIL